MDPNPTISIRLHGSLRKYRPMDADARPIAPGTTVERLAADLGIPPGKAHLAFVDGVQSEMSAVLRGGETVGLFPPLGGG